jgi:predicted permease
MNLFLTATGVVLPVVLLLAAGRIFARFAGFTESQTQGVNKLAYWVFLPALLLRDVCRAESAHVQVRMLATLAATLASMALLAFAYARLARMKPGRQGVVAQAASRSNMLFVGLPIILYYAASRLPAGASAETVQSQMSEASLLVSVALSTSVPLMNVLSVFLLALPHHGSPQAATSPARLARSVATNPLILAALLGYLARGLPGHEVWLESSSVFGRTLDLAAQGALPAALIAIGASLDPVRAVADWRHTLPVAFLKLVFMPALGLGLLLAAGVHGLPLAVALLLLACPTAASSQSMASEMGGDDALAADLVAVTTVLSPLTMVGWLVVLYALAG